MKGNEFVPHKPGKTWCGSEDSIFFTSASSWQSHDCHCREATRESSTLFSLRHYHLPRAAGRVSGCHIKIGSLFLTLQEWLAKEDGVPDFFKAVIKSQPKERTFKMGISVINVCLHHANRNGGSWGTQADTATPAVHLSFDDFWPVWRKF